MSRRRRYHTPVLPQPGRNLDREMLIQLTNASLDALRDRHELTNDGALARHLGISTKMISEWRNGHWTKADEALISALAHCTYTTNAPVLGVDNVSYR